MIIPPSIKGALIIYRMSRIRRLFYSYAQNIFDHSFPKYLEDNNNRQFICVLLESDGSIIYSSELLPDGIIREFRDRGFPAKAGYVHCDRIPNKPDLFNADLLLISHFLFETTKKNYAPIILHEACHWVILAGINCPLTTDNVGLALATELHGRLIPDDLYHDYDFCLLLANASTKQSGRSFFHGDAKSIMYSAMKYERMLEIT